MCSSDLKRPKFAYFYGYFAADGSFYRDSPRSTRFEFTDGSFVADELKYSNEFLSRIKTITEELLQTKIPPVKRTKGNTLKLAFRSKFLETIFIEKFKLMPGTKTFTIDIPEFYKNTDLEKYFWLGMMDGDGMVARNSRKIALESGSKKLMDSFKEFIIKNNLVFKKTERKIKNNIFFKVSINSNFFNYYCKLLGFYHPRKNLWIINHLKKDDFYKTHEVNIRPFCLRGNLLDYEKLFDSDRVLIVNGKSILKEYNLKYRGLKNRKFKEILEKFESLNFNKEELFTILSKYRWKMSKSSINSVILPLFFNADILKIANFVRLRSGSIGLSPLYIQSFNINPKEIISKTERIFDIKPKFTSKKEPIFCSGILAIFFSKIIKPNKKEYILLNQYPELR